MALSLIAAGSLAIGSLLGWLIARISTRSIIGRRDQGPDCDRCGKPTNRPYLWTNARLRWHCAACENWIDDQLFQLPSAPGYDRDQHMAFLSAWRDYQAEWKRVTSGEQPDPRSSPGPEA